MTYPINPDELNWAVVANGSLLGVVPCKEGADCLCRHLPTEFGVDTATYFDSFDAAHELMTSLITYGTFVLDDPHDDCDELAERIAWWAASVQVMHVDDLVKMYGMSERSDLFLYADGEES